MHIGIQLVAPNGYGLLVKGVTYYFLHSDQIHDRVLLVFYVTTHVKRSASGKRQRESIQAQASDRRDEKVYQTRLVALSRSSFEQGLDSTEIAVAPEQRRRPPWQDGVAHLNFAQIDADSQLGKKAPKKCLYDYIAERLLAINDLLEPERFSEVLSARNPDHVLNRHARHCRPVRNETRLRLWFYTYVLFGRDDWSLVPAYYASGRSNCMNKPARKKRGRPSRKGKNNGHNVTPEMKIKIINGYLEHRGLGVTMETIYAKTMNHIFGCVTGEGPRKNRYFYHPSGDAFPTMGQFRYHVKKEFDKNQIHRVKYGDKRHREMKHSSEGTYASNLGHAYERVETDGFYTDHPRGVLEKNILPSLCGVTSVDAISGLTLGIGMTLGAENKDAYNAMMFCMAINKVKFCSLFGIDIKPEWWPSEGLPVHMVFDRGPAGTTRYIASHAPVLRSRSITPARQPQSKANVESTHPRDTDIGDSSKIIVVDLNPVQLAKQMIYWVIQSNLGKDVTSRITNEMLEESIPHNPIAVFNYLDKRLRTHANPVSFPDAVRRFLKPVDFTLKPNGVYLHQQRFDSSALRATGLLERFRSTGATRVRGYVLELCVRHAWIEVNNCIVEVDAQLQIKDDATQLYVSLDDLKCYEELRNAGISEHREHARATKVTVAQLFEEDVGKRWNAGRKYTNAKKARGSEAKREASEMQRHTMRTTTT